MNRCPHCRTWGSVPAAQADRDPRRDLGIVPSTKSPPPAPPRLLTHLDALDRLLGGGVAHPTSTLLAGEPGAGKTTLCTQILHGVAVGGHRCLYASGEESQGAVLRRFHRIAASHDGVDVLELTDLAVLYRQAHRYRLAVVDSIQSFGEGIREVRHNIKRLQQLPRGGTSVIILGHVTSDGSIAGPRTLEHYVDAVLALNLDRVLTVHKNRNGVAPARCAYRMTSGGLIPAPVRSR
jgi:DNA repair protein RadA/Sms